MTDTEAPTISGIPSDITQDTDSGVATAAVTWTPPTTSDNSGSATLTSSHNSGDNFPIGDTTVTFTAVDGSNNMATGSFMITIEGIFSTRS